MRRRLAFTLPNMMMSLTLFTLVIGGIVSSQVFGLKLSQIGQLVLGASEVNPLFSQYLYNDMRKVHSVLIGQGNAFSFVEIGEGSLQTGNALLIYPQAGTNQFIRYFLDLSDKQLKRMTELPNSVLAISGYIGNTNIFSAEDFQGNLLTNKTSRKVVGLHMEYLSLKGAGAEFGAGNYFESYQYNTKYSPRTQE